LSWADYSLIDPMFWLHVLTGEGINGARFLALSAGFFSGNDEMKRVSIQQI